MPSYELLLHHLFLEATVDETALCSPGIIEKEMVLSAHTKEYFKDLTNLNLDRKAQRKTGFVHDHELILREQIIMEGTRICTEFALLHAVSMNISGGTHHAFSDRGEGFCMLNDQAIAAQ